MKVPTSLKTLNSPESESESMLSWRQWASTRSRALQDLDRPSATRSASPSRTASILQRWLNHVRRRALFPLLPSIRCPVSMSETNSRSTSSSLVAPLALPSHAGRASVDLVAMVLVLQHRACRKWATRRNSVAAGPRAPPKALILTMIKPTKDGVPSSFDESQCHAELQIHHCSPLSLSISMKLGAKDSSNSHHDMYLV